MPLDNKAPEPKWVTERTVGHYDCSNGWGFVANFQQFTAEVGTVLMDEAGHIIPHDNHTTGTCVKLPDSKGSE